MNEIRVPWEGWEVVEKLGSGSFGSACHIRRQLLGGVEDAAMKTITIPREQNEAQTLLDSGYDMNSINRRYLDDLQDIAKEYNLMAKLKGNANIVYCDDLFYEANPNGVGYTLYIRMELLTPMLQKLADPVDEQQVIKVGMDLCNALTACRAQNIIHRDIKPANILVSVDGTYKLGDFGVAKTTERTAGGTKTGTYNYMAPEVYNNQPYGLSVDIYSLGMVLYWMLNRRVGPFLPLPPELPRASQLDEAKQRRFSGEPLPPPATGSEALRRIVLKACAFDPAQRYRTPEELYADLMALNGASFRESSTWQQTARRTQRTVTQDNTASESTLGNAWGAEDEATQGSVGAERVGFGGGTMGATMGGTTAGKKSGGGKYDVHRTLTVGQQTLSSGGERQMKLTGGKTIKVHIPAGSVHGTVLRLKGLGNEEPSTGARGDLYIELHLKKEQQDVWDENMPVIKVTILRDVAIHGGTTRLQYKDMEYDWPVPAGTVDGARLMVKLQDRQGQTFDVLVAVHVLKENETFPAKSISTKLVKKTSAMKLPEIKLEVSRAASVHGQPWKLTYEGVEYEWRIPAKSDNVWYQVTLQNQTGKTFDVLVYVSIPFTKFDWFVFIVSAIGFLGCIFTGFVYGAIIAFAAYGLIMMIAEKIRNSMV